MRTLDPSIIQRQIHDKTKSGQQKEVIAAIWDYTDGLKYSNIEDFTNKQKGNISKMLNGKVPLNPEYIYALEKLFNTSYLTLLGEGETEDTLEPMTLYKATKLDNEDSYKELEDTTGDTSDNPILFNWDERGHTILDYIISNKAINGLRFLVKRNYLQMRGGNIVPNSKLFDYSEKTSVGILSIICENDDVPLFNSLYDFFKIEEWKYYDSVKLLENDNACELILNTKKIFNSLKAIKKIPITSINIGLQVKNEMDVLCYNPILNSLAVLAYKNLDKYEDKLDMILSFAIEYNKKSITNIIALSEGEPVSINDLGEVRIGQTIYGYLLTPSALSPNKLNDNCRMKLSTISEQFDSLQFPSDQANHLYKNKERIQGNNAYKYHSNNAKEYELYKMSQEQKCPYLPILISSKNGKDMLQYAEGGHKENYYNFNYKTVKPIIKILKEINAISKKHLSNGKVYCHGFINSTDIWLDKNAQPLQIVSWTHCHEGDELEDLTCVILQTIDFSLYNTSNSITSSLANLLNQYGLSNDQKDNITNILCSNIDTICDQLDNETFDYEYIFRKFQSAKITIQFIGDKLRDALYG
jgi:hypothetical protein